jgi:hypothetical protein
LFVGEDRHGVVRWLGLDHPQAGNRSIDSECGTALP